MIKKIRLQHKMAQGMYQHMTYNVSDFVLVTDKGDEIPLSEFLEKVFKLLEKQKSEEKKCEPSGAI